MTTFAMRGFAVFCKPEDYPNEWVVRGNTITDTGLHVDAELAARGATKEQCLANLFERHPIVRAYHFFPRSPDDVLSLYGTFM